MSTIDQQFIEYIVKSIVGDPDAVVVTRRIDEKGVLLELTVAPDDLGRVIGKRGAGAQSLRTLLRALGTKNDARYNLKIVDIGEDGERIERPARSGATDDQPRQDKNDAAEAPTTEALEPEEPVEVADEPEQEEGNSRLSQTRKELEDLDDLEI